MNLQHELLQTLGMSLLHSLWQGALLGLILLLALALAGRRNAALRYVIHFTGLVLLSASFIATWMFLYRTGNDGQVIQHHFPAGGLQPSFETLPGAASAGTLWVMKAQRLLEPLTPFLAAGWLTGFFALIVYTTASLLVTHRQIRRGMRLPGEELTALFHGACSRMGLPKTLNIRITAQQVSPLVLGIFRPVVVIPLAVVNGLPAGQVEAILLHELAHIKRLDPVLLVIQALAARMLFFHPLAWYLCAEIDRERENSCDDAVLRTFSDPINYIKALTMIQELNMAPVPVNTLTGKSGKLFGRVMRLLKPETRKSPTVWMAVLFVLLISFGITTFAMVTSVNKPTPDPVPMEEPAMNPVQERDTVKQAVQAQNRRGMSEKEERIREKEFENARRQFEKAQIDLLKARQEMERAREQMQIAREKFSQDALAWKWEEMPFKPEQDEQFRAQQQQFREQMKKLQEEMQRGQEWKLMQDDAFKKMQEEWSKQHSEMHPESWEFYFRDMPDVAPMPPLPEIPWITLPDGLPELREFAEPTDSLKQADPTLRLKELEEEQE